jgi:hypothetical protein
LGYEKKEVHRDFLNKRGLNKINNFKKLKAADHCPAKEKSGQKMQTALFLTNLCFVSTQER